jgi:hypothetical protein
MTPANTMNSANGPVLIAQNSAVKRSAFIPPVLKECGYSVDTPAEEAV